MSKLRQRSKSVFVAKTGPEPIFNNHYSDNDDNSSDDENIKDSNANETFFENITIKTEKQNEYSNFHSNNIKKEKKTKCFYYILQHSVPMRPSI